MAKSIVFIIDDSPLDLSILTEILKSDYAVHCATDPGVAMEMLRTQTPPDLIILDIMMPGKDGLSISRAMKANPATAGVPIIFVTSRDGVEDEAAGFDAGGVDYVTKPVNPHLLRARVRTHVELKRAREALEKQNEMLREHARLREEMEHISRHDLKNPLMVILNVPGLLKRQPNVTPEQVRWLTTVEEAARRMLEMINRSIDLFRMENGVYQLKAVEVDALAVARQVEAAVDQLCRMGGVTLRVLVSGRTAGPSDSFLVMAEELLLFTMLCNLAKNAIEASPPGAEVSISFQGGQTATIALHNRGVIPEKIRERFFEKFATAGKQGGTGLGAYSARLIATTLGGSISFTSSEEEGTTITVQLPRGS